MTIVVFPLDEIPFYNADYDADHLRPPEVTRMKQTVAEADALLIATPEGTATVCPACCRTRSTGRRGRG